MMLEKEFKRISQFILSRSKADQTEVVVMSSEESLTRFANSTIHQNVSGNDTEVRIRVVKNKQIGVATSNYLSDEALERTLRSAEEIAEMSPPNPHFKSLPEPKPITEVDALHPSTRDFSPDQRALGVLEICQQARANDVVASGAFSTATQVFGVANSLGVSVHFERSMTNLSTVIMSNGSSGYAEQVAGDVDEIDPAQVGKEALQKCLRSRNPRDLEPGEYTVILEPYAAHDIAMMMAYTGLGATAYNEERSFMCGKIGEQLIDPRISFIDDGLDPAGLPFPFDFEGVPRQRVSLIENGIPRNVVYDSYQAGRSEGKVSTGHAFPAPNVFGPIPGHINMSTGDSNLKEMIRNTKRGVYITRFHYTRPVEPAQVTVTGLTRDGTFFVENGEIAYPIKNLRFTQSYIQALNNIVAIGKTTKLVPVFGLSAYRMPAIMIEKFNFTGATTY